MRQTFGALALLSVMAFLPSVAEAAGNGKGGGYVNTPFGQFSMGSMNQAGGNPFVAEQMREQQMYMQYQQQMMKQQQQYMQQMQKMQKAGQNPSGNMQQNASSSPSSKAFNTVSKKKKKKPTTTPKTTVSTKSSKGAKATDPAKDKDKDMDQTPATTSIDGKTESK